VNSYRTVDFIDRMDWAIAAADLVVCRAGASTLAELAAIGRPAILMPYPFHRDQHQRHNGQVLVDAGAAVMIEDRRELEANVAQLVGPLAELMTDSAKREAMGRAARAIGKPAAAEAVVDELLRLA
jgi:UDP-N-acetylglucosamine--N-acetylmuramyl-(pentapeptide) pyrophosphoryl-undecaprenol N-acetylglucosamine transferase